MKTTLPQARKRGAARIKLAVAIGSLFLLGAALSSGVPNEIQMPGTQPLEVTGMLDSSNCTACHAGFDPANEPYRGWQGSMMGHASRDALFWAAVAVAEQDFSGSGDTCLRCHTSLGWIGGRSTPTDGSSLIASDFDGVTCHTCHRLTNPDKSELIGVQNAPFVANDGQNPAHAYLGSGQYVLWGGAHRLGPYSDPITPHQWLQSSFHRSSDLCGTCHDVSNPLTGDLAHNNGAQVPLAPGTFSGVLGSPVDGKAAFNNFPYQYGVIERTFSEHTTTPLASMLVSDYGTLPAELKAGSLARTTSAVYTALLGGGNTFADGNYEDGTPRYFTCQSCHMRPAFAKGCNFIVGALRRDLPAHDLTGGNYWMPSAIQWLDTQNRLVGGGGLTPTQKTAMNAGALRAKQNLRDAAALQIAGNTLKVFNLTGHKLISGYPEGRRMWLHTRWYDASNQLVREDGAYGPISTTINGQPATVETLLDLNDPNTRIYQSLNGLTQQWASQLLGFGVAGSTPLSFDRVTGAVEETIGGLAASAPGSTHASLHFVLNNTTLSDNRIPPFRMDYDQARIRNALPVPATQFGNPGPGGEYRHWDEFALNPPNNAVSAQIELLYQPTSWEYVQFLHLANTGAISHLATTGADVLDAWLATGMAAPEVMARVSWGTGAPAVYCTAKTNSLGCVPSIGSTGAPSATQNTGFYILASHELNRHDGVLYYGTSGPSNTPFQGGTMCVGGGKRRGVVQSSGGNALPASDCSGSYSVDFNAHIASGADHALVAGAQVWAQFWSRDPASPGTTNTTDALTFTITN